MGKVALVALVLFVVAMVWPELRTLMLVSGVSVMLGMMIGSHHTSRHTAELHANRAERQAENVALRTIEA
jgi:hypothetical protein